MHTPVMLLELVDNIFTDRDGIYIDCTGGGGSHSFELLSRLSDKGSLIILDKDLDAVDRLQDRFKDYKNVRIIHSSFRDILEVVEREKITGTVSGIIADFGTSAYQLKDAERGFSFRLEGDIDMRMDRTQEFKASDIVDSYDEHEIFKIIIKYGEEKFARSIARNIVKYREGKRLDTTLELSEVIATSIPKKFHKYGISPATKTFQAFRIYVNKELEDIEILLSSVSGILKVTGRFGAISFHSLEDRLVKKSFIEHAKNCTCPPLLPMCICNRVPEYRIVTRKAIVPSAIEVTANPLSRSAKLRVAEKIN